MTRDAGLMLRCTMAVLRSQREHIRENTHYAETYKASVAIWQGWYGGFVVDEVRAKVRERRWRAVTEDVAVLARYYPRGLAKLILPARAHRLAGALVRKLEAAVGALR
jgi:hypothetical protein